MFTINLTVLRVSRTAEGTGIDFNLFAISARGVRDVYFDSARACVQLPYLCRGGAAGESHRLAIVDVAGAWPRGQ